MKSAERRIYTMGARADGVAATRERIARAALRLALQRPYEEITLSEIAEAAGVSHQTVLNRFESKEGAFLAAAEILRAETGDARQRAKPGEVEGAVSILVGEYERIGDANARWASSSERLGKLAFLLDQARAGHQEWLGRIFARWLPAPAAARRRMVNALHAATDVYTWKLLRRDLRLSRAETERTMIDLVAGVLQRGSAASRRSGRSEP
jgi:AcrR family transcriptional regulator